MIAFLDFEASSLSKHSFPIEVAWVFEDGRSKSRLIKPKAGWIDWSQDAQSIHGISRELLETEGTELNAVAAEMMSELAGHALYASSPSWDGKWLSVLLRGAGVPRHALRLQKSDDLFIEVAAEIMASVNRRLDAEKLVADVITSSEPAQPAHRALPDAMLELRRLDLVKAAARALSAS